MSDKEIEEKLRTAASGWNLRYNIEPLIDAIWTLDMSADVSKLSALTVPHG